MILSDCDIKMKLEKWEIQIQSDYDIYDQIWPASVDFRLGNHIKYYDKNQVSYIDPKQAKSDKYINETFIQDWSYFVIHPRQFVLWVSRETISVPNNLVARCEWRSSLWRLWLIIHSTAWFIDPGFSGTITLEITNINEIPIRLYAWMRIWQFAFEALTNKCQVDYWQRHSSKYMNQSQAQTSKIYSDKDY